MMFFGLGLILYIPVNNFSVMLGWLLLFLLKINSLYQNCSHVSDDFVTRTRSFKYELVSVSLDNILIHLYNIFFYQIIIVKIW